MIEYRDGDLFEAGIPVLAHGVNLWGFMGSGIAREFRSRWPEMYAEYQEQCREGVLTLGRYHEWTAPYKSVTVFNLATQPAPGPYATVGAVREATGRMLSRAQEERVKAVAVPRIGCGLGGLDWERDVRPALEAVAAGSPVRLVVVTPVPGQEGEK